MSGRIPSIMLAGALVMGMAASGTPAAGAAPARVGRQAPLALLIQIQPNSGSGGTLVRVKGTGFTSNTCNIVISFTDADRVYTQLASVPRQPSFKTEVQIPTGAAVGPGHVTALQMRILGHMCVGEGSASAMFTVTP